MSYFIHESSFVDENVRIGNQTRIWHFSHILENCKIGEQCSFGQNSVVGPNVTIGNKVKVQNNVSIYEGVTLEDDVFVGPSVVFTNVINPRSFIVRKEEYKNTLIKKGASIGANTTIICGIQIGKYALVGAGSVVTEDILDFELVYGVPTTHKEWIGIAGNKLHFKNNYAEDEYGKYRFIDNHVEYIVSAD